MDEFLSLDPGRLVFVLVTFFLYFYLSIRSSRWLFYSALFLLILLPFNITLQLSYFFPGYLSGIVSNYTIPTLSILDVFIFFSLCALCIQKRFWKDFNLTEKYFFLAFFMLLTLKASIDFNVLSVLVIYRIFFYVLTIYTLCKYVLLEKNFFKILPSILFASVLIQFVIGALQFWHGKSLGLVFLGESQVVKGMFGSSFIELSQQLFLRAYGTFPHPNVLAGYLFFALAFALFSNPKDKRSNLLLLTSIISSILILLTFSRVVIFLSLGLWLLFFFYQFRNRGAALPGYIPLFLERFLSFDNSFTDRIELVKNAVAVIQNYFWFGIGAGRYVYGIDYHPIYTAGGFLLLEPVHNIYLLILAEYGIIFGLPVMIMIFYYLGNIFLRGNFVLKYLVLSIFLISIFDHYFLTLPQGLFIFLFSLVFMRFCISYRKDLHEKA